MKDVEFVLPPEIQATVSACIEERDRLRAENEALAEKLDKVAALVNNLPLTKIAVDGALIVSVTKYNALIDALRSEGD